MVDVTEILIDWHAGRSISEVAASLGADRKTIRPRRSPHRRRRQRLGVLVLRQARRPLRAARPAGRQPVRSELTWLLVRLDRQVADRQPAEPWERYYAKAIIEHFTPGA